MLLVCDAYSASCKFWNNSMALNTLKISSNAVI